MNIQKPVLTFANRHDRCVYAKIPKPLPLCVTWHKGMAYSGPEFGYPVEVERVLYKADGRVIVQLEGISDEGSRASDSANHYRKHGWVPWEEFAAEQERQQAVDDYLHDYAKACGVMVLPRHYPLVTNPADRVAYGDKSAFVDKGTEKPAQQETQ